MSGKGSKPRPYSISPEKFASNWDAIFGKKQNKPKEKDKTKQDKIMPDSHSG